MAEPRIEEVRPEAQAPLLQVIWNDDETEARGYVVIDRLVAGIATGGLRMRQGCSLGEVADLAREMSLKMGVFGLPVGGGKGGIDFDPGDHRAAGVRARFLQTVRPLLETCWVTAGDLGTQQRALDRAFEELGLGSSSFHAALVRAPSEDVARNRVKRAFESRQDGLTMAELIGGFGVAMAGIAALEELGPQPAPATAVVQGFGAMGGSTALYLYRGGVKVVGVADSAGLILNHAQGLDVEALLASRDDRGLIDRAALRSGDVEVAGELWVEQDVDMLVPAAASYAITATNCELVRARVIVEAANVPTTPEAELRLSGRGVTVVPDFVANAGAAVGAWWVILDIVQTPAGACARLASEMKPLVVELVRRAMSAETTMRSAAEDMAAQKSAGLIGAYGGAAQVRDLF